ncbi:MAG TPA: hemerythrin domain-containing protein [Phnomibacter sp.]|nr:hemerythrin domain-containing protein [Phnomibacter sp.]
MEAQNEATNPIRRHAALVSYSREHHHGLLLVWKIRMGHKKEVAPVRIAGLVVWSFENDLAGHFRDEEVFLAPHLPNGDPLLQRLQEEHAALRELVDEIDADPTSYELQAIFADKLELHIRFEERELFNYLQEHLSADALKELELVERTSPKCNTDEWDDPFWLSK